MSLQTVTSRIYADTDLMGANVACVETEQGLVLIDTPYLPNEIQQWKEALGRLNNKGIAYLIDTHHHFDHCLGNAFFGPSVIAHQSTYDEMVKPDGTMRRYFVSENKDLAPEVKQQVFDIPIALPRFTFTDRMWLCLGDATFELVQIGGHTESTILIFLVEDRVLFTGDAVVSNMHPYKGQAHFGEWIRGLEMIQGMDIDAIVPGHGEVCDKAEAKRTLDYFKQMWDRVATLRRAGHTKDEVVKRAHDLIGFYPVDPGMEVEASMRFDEGIARLYDEMEAEAA